MDYDLLLYDVTSTYFEGEAKDNPQMQRGYCKKAPPGFAGEAVEV